MFLSEFEALDIQYHLHHKFVDWVFSLSYVFKMKIFMQLFYNDFFFFFGEVIFDVKKNAYKQILKCFFSKKRKFKIIILILKMIFNDHKFSKKSCNENIR